MNVDCTLNSFNIPGFSGLSPIFGTMKPGGEDISSREAHFNIAMPFTLMRPHIVNEDSTTTEIEVNSVFDMTVAGITLEISEAAYNQCKAHILNSSNGIVSVLVNETETISLFRGEIIDIYFDNGKWRRKSPKETVRALSAFDFLADYPRVASTGNVDVSVGGNLTIDGVVLANGDLVFLKDQTDPAQNGLFVVQSGSWNRSPGYANGNTLAFTNKFISPKEGSQAGKIFFLVEDDYTVGTDGLTFIESKFAVKPFPGKFPIYDKNGMLFSTDKRHADQVDGMGRDLRILFGITSADPTVYIPLIMAEIRRRCNNNGEIDATGIPDFIGIEIGDFIDGLDLSGTSSNAPGGTAPQAWNNQYKNNRLMVSGFNTYKNFGDTENTKNHILFTFRNCIAQGYMKSSDDNAGGYPATLMRTWLEGSTGDGTGALATKLKAALGGAVNYLYTIRKLHSKKRGAAWEDPVWASYTVFLPSELEVFGYQTFGDEVTGPSCYNTNVHFPIFSKSGVYRIKRYNGARAWWWLSTPYAAYSAYFATVDTGGAASYTVASAATGGVAPAFCVA